jgi:hypothetical protein
MGQEDSSLQGRPLEDRVVVGAGEPDVLDADCVELWETPEQTPQDVVVEVFVRQEAHEALLLARLSAEAPRKEPLPDARLVEARFVCSTERLPLRLSLAEVLIHLGSAPQVVRDDVIDVGEPQGRVSLSDFLGCGAVQERTHDGVEGDSCVRHPHHAVGIGVEGRGVCKEGK